MGLRIRQYKPCDAEHIVSWIKDEEALRKWSSDRFGEFPITSEDINKKYLDNNGDCVEQDNFYPLVAFDIFGAEKITLGVFDNNESAYFCYKAAGFVENGEEMFCELFGKQWRIVEMEITRQPLLVTMTKS